MKRDTRSPCIILHWIFSLNVTRPLLCCCVHFRTARRLAALQTQAASSYPISAERRRCVLGGGFNIPQWDSRSRSGQPFGSRRRPAAAAHRRDPSRGAFVNPISSSESQTKASSNPAIDCDGASRGERPSMTTRKLAEEFVRLDFKSRASRFDGRKCCRTRPNSL